MALISYPRQVNPNIRRKSDHQQFATGYDNFHWSGFRGKACAWYTKTKAFLASFPSRSFVSPPSTFGPHLQPIYGRDGGTHKNKIISHLVFHSRFHLESADVWCACKVLFGSIEGRDFRLLRPDYRMFSSCWRLAFDIICTSDREMKSAEKRFHFAAQLLFSPLFPFSRFFPWWSSIVRGLNSSSIFIHFTAIR